MASVLLVCTGNVCRSPLAEGLVRAAFVRRFGDAAPVVSSAGTAAWDGSAPMAESIAAAAELGVDISRQRARQLTPDLIEASDLALAMGQEHRDAIERAVPDAIARTFTLKELVRLLEALPDAGASAEPGAALLSRISDADALRGRGVGNVVGESDFADPLGEPLDVYRDLAEELLGWSERLADGLFGRTPARTFSQGGT